MKAQSILLPLWNNGRFLHTPTAKRGDVGEAPGDSRGFPDQSERSHCQELSQEGFPEDWIMQEGGSGKH